jgi:hypothetical protein
MAPNTSGQATFCFSLLDLPTLEGMRACVNDALHENPDTHYLRDLAWFLAHRTIPPWMDPWDRLLLRDFAGRLVIGGVLTVDVLEQFRPEPV